MITNALLMYLEVSRRVSLGIVAAVCVLAIIISIPLLIPYVRLQSVMMSRFILNLRRADSSPVGSFSTISGCEVKFQRSSLLGNMGSPLDIDGENERELGMHIDEAEDGLWASGSTLDGVQEPGEYRAVRRSDSFELKRNIGDSTDEEALLGPGSDGSGSDEIGDAKS